MPKRQNPFGDSSPLQFKSRIGVKEVDLGVSSVTNMQAVYDKTKALMFAGARKTNPPCTTVGQAGDTLAPQYPHPLPGQLRLDAEGRLSSLDAQPMDGVQSPVIAIGGDGPKAVTGFFNNNNYNNCQVAQVKDGQLQLNALGQLTSAVRAKPCSFQGAGVLPTQCRSCQRFSSTLRPCGFCEKNTCAGCVRMCSGCQLSFCQLCSMLNYEDSMERAFCLQCAS